MSWVGFPDDINTNIARSGLAMVLCGALGDKGDKVACRVEGLGQGYG